MKGKEIRFINLFDIFRNDFFTGEKHCLLIPGYQRGYKWSVKRNVKEDSSVEYFVKSLINNLENSSEFFLQGITVNEHKKENTINIEIVDGQQRITTLYLLLWYLRKDNISQTELKYDSREDTQIFLNDLKNLSREEYKEDNLHLANQDITFLKQAILQIREILDKLDSNLIERLDSFIRKKIKVIYVPIDREKILSTFTMMNGSKAIMYQEELIKAELLKRVSDIIKSNPVQFDNIDEAIDSIRVFSALDWQTALQRSKYAREWDKWLQWWHKPEIIKYYGIDRRRMGLLLRYFARDINKIKGGTLDFREFTKLIDHNPVGEIFEKLRKLQKQFEDLYDNPITYNLLGVALKSSSNDRYETIKFFRDNINNIEKLKIYTAKRVYGCSHNDIINNNNTEEIKIEFKKIILDPYLYENNSEIAYHFLLWLNVIQDNKLNRKFNFRAWDYKSLEHLYPKSKVFHSHTSGEEIIYRTGGNNEISKEQYENKPEDVIYREDIQKIKINGESLGLTEHSIGNLVLLFTHNNSEFNDKSFNEKKEIFFKMDITDKKERERVFESRSLIHSMSKFAEKEWGAQQIADYYKEIVTILENGLENE